MIEPASIVRRQRWEQNGQSEGSRSVPEETAIALTYNGGTHAVMMATPLDLEDFALGFSLNEGIIDSASDIQSLDVLSVDDGIEVRIWLGNSSADRLQRRRRHMAGTTGFGLFGLHS